MAVTDLEQTHTVKTDGVSGTSGCTRLSDIHSQGKEKASPSETYQHPKIGLKGGDPAAVVGSFDSGCFNSIPNSVSSSLKGKPQFQRSASLEQDSGFYSLPSKSVDTVDGHSGTFLKSGNDELSLSNEKVKISDESLCQESLPIDKEDVIEACENPKYENMIKTFKKWPKNNVISPQKLIESHMVYSGESDITICVTCKATFREWEETDNPLQIHIDLYPNCLWVKAYKSQLKDKDINSHIQEESGAYYRPKENVIKQNYDTRYTDSVSKPSSRKIKESSLPEPKLNASKSKEATYDTENTVTDIDRDHARRLSKQYKKSAPELLDLVEQLINISFKKEDIWNALDSLGSSEYNLDTVLEQIYHLQTKEEDQLFKSQEGKLESNADLFSENSSCSSSESSYCSASASVSASGSESSNSAPVSVPSPSRSTSSPAQNVPHPKPNTTSSSNKNVSQTQGVDSTDNGCSDEQPRSRPNSMEQFEGEVEFEKDGACTEPEVRVTDKVIILLPAKYKKLTKKLKKEIMSNLNYDQREQIKDFFRQKNEQYRTQRTCKVCLEKTVNRAYLPCGHLACCDECTPQMRNCPICRSTIKALVRVALVSRHGGIDKSDTTESGKSVSKNDPVAGRASKS